MPRPLSLARPVRARAAGIAIPVAVLGVALLLAPAPAGAWGGVGHRVIAARYGASLPPALQPLRSEDAWITDHVLDADACKGTVPGERVLDADTQARAAAGGSTSSGTYDGGLWSRTAELTLARLEAAAVATASFVTTAWMRAGAPPVPGGTVDAGVPGAGAGALAVSAGPTPARGALVLRFTLPSAGAPVFELVDARGRHAARLEPEARPAGPGRLTWDLGRDVAPGVYFLRLVFGSRVAEARAVVAR